MNRSLKRFFFVLGIVLLAAMCQTARADVLPRPARPAPVIDAAGLLPENVLNSWNATLKDLQDSTGVQVVLVTVNTLDDRDVADYAQELYQKWGIGDKTTNRGVLVLVKPKTESSKGRIRIHTGYGMEADLPDAFCNNIIQDSVIPWFKQNDYISGMGTALRIIDAVARGEFDREGYEKQKAIEAEQKKAALLEQERQDRHDTGLLGGICCLWPVLLGVWFFWFRRQNNGHSVMSDPSIGSSHSGGGYHHSSRYDNDDYDSGSSWSSSSDSYDYGGGSSGGGGASGSW